MYKKICKYLNDFGLIFDDMKVELQDDGDGVVYISKWEYDIAMPTAAELNAIEQADIDALFYAEKRVQAYPKIGDQLDALWKFVEAQNPAGDAANILAQIQTVKTTYPKES